MAAVTGPISTLPGTHRSSPEGQMCDDHDDRPAVARIQGETDSMGCEMHDLCQECLDRWRSEPSENIGTCDICKAPNRKLFHWRDYEEGSCGPVYQIDEECRTRIRKREAQDLEDSRSDDFYVDFDFED